MTNTFQDFDFIAAAISMRVTVENGRNEDVLTHNAWNILRGINCNDATVFETIINGICNAFDAGFDDCEFVEHMWNDPWDK